jgi:hypothetical protein
VSAAAVCTALPATPLKVSLKIGEPKNERRQNENPARAMMRKLKGGVSGTLLGLSWNAFL